MSTRAHGWPLAAGSPHLPVRPPPPPVDPTAAVPLTARQTRPRPSRMLASTGTLERNTALQALTVRTNCFSPYYAVYCIRIRTAGRRLRAPCTDRERMAPPLSLHGDGQTPNAKRQKA